MGTGRRSAPMFAVLIVAIAATATAENSVFIESKEVAPGTRGVTVGVYITNEEDLVGATIPLEIRSIAPGAFIADAFDIQPTGRLARSGLVDLQVTRLCGEPAANNRCSGPTSHTWSCVNGGVVPERFYENPSGVMWGGVSTTGPAMARGADVPGEPSLTLTFDVSGAPGRFEIDTCCMTPANNLLFVDDQYGPVFLEFTRGIITIGDPQLLPNNPPIALCHDTLVITGVRPKAEIDAADIDAGSYDPDHDYFVITLAPPGPYARGDHAVFFIASDGDLADTCTALITVAENAAPVARCHDTTVNLRGGETAEIEAADIDAGSYDPDPDSFTMTVEPPGPYPLGEHSVLLIVSDGDRADTCTAHVTVMENRAPVAQCTDVVVDDPSLCEIRIPGSEVGAGSFDPDGDPITLTLDPPGPYLLGENPVQLVVSDGLLDDACNAMITVSSVGEAYVVCPLEARPDFQILHPSPGEATVQFLTPDLSGQVNVCAPGLVVEVQQSPPPGWFLLPDVGAIALTVIVDETDTTSCEVPLNMTYWPFTSLSHGSDLPIVSVSADLLPGVCPNVMERSVREAGVDILSALVLGSDEVDVFHIAASTLRLRSVAPSRWEIADIAAPPTRTAYDLCACSEEGADGYPDLYLEYDWLSVLYQMDLGDIDTLIGLDLSGKIAGEQLAGGDCLTLVAPGEDTDPEPIIGAATALRPLDNYPNPFNSGTVIRFSLSQQSPVKLRVYNVLGQRVRTLVDGVRPSGFNQISWDGTDQSGRPVASGLYLCRLTAEGRTEGRKMVLLR